MRIAHLSDCHLPRPALIFTHHPPLDIGVPWLDRMNLRNLDRFWAVVAQHGDRLRGVFVPHLHLQITCSYRGVLVAGCPATSWQFCGNSDAETAERSSELPGFNLLDLVGVKLCIHTVRFDPEDWSHGSVGGRV